MRLTSAEYQNGIVKWRCGFAATIRLKAANNAVASRVMHDPSGSIPDVVPDGKGIIELQPVEPSKFDGRYSVAWDRLVGDEIETLVLDTDQGLAQFVGIPARGRFERLVVSAPYLKWDEDSVVRVGDVVVRFSDSVSLERQQPTRIEHDELRSSFTFGVSTEQLSGTFLEVIAPDVIDKEHNVAFVVLALIALVVGEAAVGDMVQLDSLESTPIGTEYSVRFPQHHLPSAPNRVLRMPHTVTPEEIDAFDQLLARLLEDNELRVDVMLPLRWYERALRTGNDVDRFLAAFLGLETLVMRLSRRHGFVSPMADLLDEPKIPDLLEPLRDTYQDDQVDRLISRLQNKSPSLLDRFERVADTLRLGEASKIAFRSASKARHTIVHGGRGRIDTDLARETTNLLTRALRSALG